MKYFNLNKFLMLILFILVIVLYIFNFGLLNLDESLRRLVNYCSLFFGIIIFFNALFISLLELTKFDKQS